MTVNVTVHNFPEYAKNKDIVVARVFDGNLWFFGSWNKEDEQQALEACKNIDGVMIRRF